MKLISIFALLLSTTSSVGWAARNYLYQCQFTGEYPDNTLTPNPTATHLPGSFKWRFVDTREVDLGHLDLAGACATASLTDLVCYEAHDKDSKPLVCGIAELGRFVMSP